MRVYRHYRPVAVWAPLLLFGLLVIAGLGCFVWSILDTSGSMPPPFFFLILVGVAGFNLWVSGGVLEVHADDDGNTEFVGPLRRTRVAMSSIMSIKPSQMSTNTSLFVLRHQGGTIRFDPRLDGMHELILEIKRRNPTVELRGI
jgi:hypothetical protein